MTKTEPQQQEADRKYPLIRSTDGCDETFEVISVTNRRIAWCGFWEQEAAAKRSAGKVAAFLREVAQCGVTIDLAELINELKDIASSWGWDEVRQANPDLSDAEIWNLLNEKRYYSPAPYAHRFPHLVIEDAEDVFSQAATDASS